MTLMARLSNPKVEPQPKPQRVPEWIRRKNEGKLPAKELVAA